MLILKEPKLRKSTKFVLVKFQPVENHCLVFWDKGNIYRNTVAPEKLRFEKRDVITNLSGTVYLTNSLKANDVFVTL